MDVQSTELLHLVNDGHFLARALHVAAELGVADVVGDMPLPVAVIAEKVGAQADPLARVIRLLATRGIFVLEGGLADGRVSHTPASRMLAANHPQSFRPFARNTSTTRSWRLPEHMLQMVKTGEPAVGAGTMWSQLKSSPDDARIFDAAMAAKAHSQVTAVVRAHDFSRYGRVVDVGGGAGHLLRGIVAKWPKVHGVLFDRPDVAEAARKSGTSSQLEIVGGDFFAEVPPGDATIVMDVLHDWSDEECVRILKTIRKAAKPGGTLVAVETEVSGNTGLEWGKLLDVIMMTLFAGRQRSRAEFEAMFAAAGYRLTQAVPTQSDVTLFIGEAI